MKFYDKNIEIKMVHYLGQKEKEMIWHLKHEKIGMTDKEINYLRTMRFYFILKLLSTRTTEEKESLKNDFREYALIAEEMNNKHTAGFFLTLTDLTERAAAIVYKPERDGEYEKIGKSMEEILANLGYL